MKCVDVYDMRQNFPLKEFFHLGAKKVSREDLQQDIDALEENETLEGTLSFDPEGSLFGDLLFPHLRPTHRPPNPHVQTTDKKVCDWVCDHRCKRRRQCIHRQVKEKKAEAAKGLRVCPLPASTPRDLAGEQK